VSRRLIIILFASLAGSSLLKPVVQASPDSDSLSLLYTTAPQYDPLAWIHGGERFPSGATVLVRRNGRTRPLAADFTASADPAISFDGQRVLFAGKQKPTDPWQIWEVSLAEGKPRRISSGVEDCVRPFYLPEDRIVYARKIAGRFAIEAVSVTGGKPLGLTYGPENALPSDVLRDGRILFESAFPGTAGATPEIYTVYSDGSGVESYRCDHKDARYSAKQLGSGDVVFAAGSTLAKFTPARAQQVPVMLPAAEYAGDVAEDTSGEWIVPSRTNSSSPYQLAVWTPSSADLRPVVSDSRANVLQPVVLHEHTVPNRHPSGLHDWAYANLLCLNSYTSKDKVAAGSIHSMRLYTRGDNGAAKLLGAASVERDGSFFIQVPGDQPLQIELLDTAGKTLKREKGFFWARRGEQRVCVGCHVGPETAPENAVPMILLKSTIPADLTGLSAPNASGGH
jgi:hypothetical protein